MRLLFRRKGTALLSSALFTFLPTFAENKPVQPQQPTLADIVDKVSGSIVRVEAVFSFQIQGENSPQSFTSSGKKFHP